MLPPNFDGSNVKNRIKWDFVGTIIGANSNLSKNQFNNIEKALSSRLFVKQNANQLFQRFILCLIVNYCFVVQFILLYYHFKNCNNNNNQWLTAFECIGPSLAWIIIVITMSIWFGYKCDLPELNDEMLCYQTVHFRYKEQTESASVFNFFLSLNQFNVKVYQKHKFRNIVINIMLFLFGLIYCGIPSVLRFICDSI